MCHRRQPAKAFKLVTFSVKSSGMPVTVLVGRCLCSYVSYVVTALRNKIEKSMMGINPYTGFRGSIYKLSGGNKGHVFASARKQLCLSILMGRHIPLLKRVHVSLHLRRPHASMPCDPRPQLNAAQSIQD